MIRIHEYRRVIGVGQVLYLAGQRLKRVGIKYTMLAVLISASAILVDVVGTRVAGLDLPWKKLNVAMIPALVALLTVGVGHALIGLSNLFSSQRLLFADANSMNLMEDRKKAELREHLDLLWRNVFRYEARIEHYGSTHEQEELERIHRTRGKVRKAVAAWDGEMRGHLGVGNEEMDEFVRYVECFRPVSTGLEATHDGFTATAEYAVVGAMPQKVQQALSGCDLSLLEDWYDGAFFTATDCKLQEQYSANKTLRAIREEIGIPWRVRMGEMVFGYPLPLWHVLTMKKIGTTVGGLIHRFNRKYTRECEPDFFDAQDFLWKDARSEQLIVRTFGEQGPLILAEVRRCRRKMFRDIFSNDRRNAHEQICRMFGRDFVRALELRLDYDVEFAAGLLDNTPEQDVHWLEIVLACRPCSRAILDRKIALAKEHLESADAFVDAHLPTLRERPGGLRAFRVAHHVDRGGLRGRIAEDAKAAARWAAEHVVAGEARYSHHVCMLRQHYELARVQLTSYVKMVDEIAEFSSAGENHG